VAAIKPDIEKLKSAQAREALSAADALGDKCKTDDVYKKPIIEAGGIQLAVKLLGDTKDEKPARLLMYLLAGGAGSESANQALLEEPGAVPSLVEVLQKGSSEARSYSAAVLRNVSEDSEARSKAVAQQEGVVEGLVGLVTAPLSDPCAQRRAAEALGNLARHHGIRLSKDAISKLAQLCLSRDEDVAEAAEDALENLARHDANKATVDQVNAVKAHVEKLKSNVASDAEAAAEALFNICDGEDDDVLERLVVKLGGMTPAMKLLDGTPTAQENAAALLMLLVNTGDSAVRALAENPNAISSLVKVLRSGAAPAQADSAGVLRNASHSEACSKAMAEKGAIEGLVELLSSGGRTRQRRAAGALANLACQGEGLRTAIGKAGAIGPLVELRASDDDDVAAAAGDALDNLALNDENKEVIKASEKKAPAEQPEAEGPTAADPAQAVQACEQKAPGEQPEAKMQAGYPTPTPSSVLPDGKGARLAMFSLRFDNGPIEAKFRRIHQLLKSHNFNVLMVDADAGDNFGTMTMDYLDELVENKGLMIAVCTKHYGEKTASPYSSFNELRYAQDYQLDVLPLKVADIYPPQPPSGPDHKYDQKGEARKLLRMVLRPNISFFDCCSLSEQEIALKIANKLLGRGHGVSGHG
ncbi:PUB10, partial [Symbiodinium natans]